MNALNRLYQTLKGDVMSLKYRLIWREILFALLVILMMVTICGIAITLLQSALVLWHSGFSPVFWRWILTGVGLTLVMWIGSAVDRTFFESSFFGLRPNPTPESDPEG